MELMMTLALVAVVLAIGAPNFREFRLNSRMTGSANDLLASLQLARSEAIKRQQPVAICPSQNPEATPPACRVDPVWSDSGAQSGMVVWVDTNDDGVPGAGETVIAPQQVLSSQLTVRSNFNGVTYQPSGFAAFSGLVPNAEARFVLICDERANQQIGDSYRKRVLAITQTGRAQVIKEIAALAGLGSAGFVNGTLACPQT